MASEEGLAEVYCLRMNVIAVNPRRVDAQRGKSGTPGLPQPAKRADNCAGDPHEARGVEPIPTSRMT
jgi:hypothetical protein